MIFLAEGDAALREATVGGVVEFAGASGGSKLVNCVFVGNSDFQSMNMPAETTCAGAIAVNHYFHLLSIM